MGDMRAVDQTRFSNETQHGHVKHRCIVKKHLERSTAINQRIVTAASLTHVRTVCFFRKQVKRHASSKHVSLTCLFVFAFQTQSPSMSKHGLVELPNSSCLVQQARIVRGPPGTSNDRCHKPMMSDGIMSYTKSCIVDRQEPQIQCVATSALTVRSEMQVCAQRQVKLHEQGKGIKKTQRSTSGLEAPRNPGLPVWACRIHASSSSDGQHTRQGMQIDMSWQIM